LPLIPAGATQVSDRISVVKQDERWTYFNGIDPVCSHQQDDLLSGVSRSTIERGIVELDQFPSDPAAGRVRRPGGGRKKKSILTANSKAT